MVKVDGLMPTDKALRVFRALLNRSPEKMDIAEWERWMLREAHDMYRNEELSGAEFAIVIDEAVCY